MTSDLGDYLDGSEKVDAVLAEFWKPQKADKGQTLVGRVKSVYRTPFDQYAAIFEPVVLWPSKKVGGVPQGYHSLRVKINTWLDKLVNVDSVGLVLAITFAGMKGTPKGQMRVFRVVRIEDERWDQMLRDHAPQLQDQGTPFDRDAGDDLDDDDLPF